MAAVPTPTRVAGWRRSSTRIGPTARSRSGTTRGSAPGTTGQHLAVEPFWDALYAAGADLVVNGHDHDYERFAPVDPAGNPDPDRGIRQIVAGTGGAELRPFEEEDPNSEVRDASTSGVLRLDLRPGALRLGVHPGAGRVVHGPGERNVPLNADFGPRA